MPGKKQTPEPLEVFGAGIQQLFNDPTFSDVVVRCQNVQFHLHKNILKCHGGYFGNAIKNDFKEGSSGVIELSNDEDPEVIRALLRYLYCHTWKASEGYTPAEFEAKIYAAADYYQLPHVKARARHNFAAIAYMSKDPVDNAASCFAAAPIIYNHTPNTDRGLRDIVVGVTISRIDALLDDNDENQTKLKAIPDFALDVLMRRKPSVDWRGKKEFDVLMACPKCRLIFAVDPSSNTVDYDWSPNEPNKWCTCPGCKNGGLTAEFYAHYRQVTGTD